MSCVTRLQRRPRPSLKLGEKGCRGRGRALQRWNCRGQPKTSMTTRGPDSRNPGPGTWAVPGEAAGFAEWAQDLSSSRQHRDRTGSRVPMSSELELSPPREVESEKAGPRPRPQPRSRVLPSGNVTPRAHSPLLWDWAPGTVTPIQARLLKPEAGAGVETRIGFPGIYQVKWQGWGVASIPPRTMRASARPSRSTLGAEPTMWPFDQRGMERGRVHNTHVPDFDSYFKIHSC